MLEAVERFKILLRCAELEFPRSVGTPLKILSWSWRWTSATLWEWVKTRSENLKPVIDVLAPVALVYFALKTDSLNTKIADIQQKQAIMQERQADYAQVALPPAIVVTMKKDKEGTRLLFLNRGGLMSEITFDYAGFIQLFLGWGKQGGACSYVQLQHASRSKSPLGKPL